MTDKKPKIYFNGLDGLRAIAAFAVVFHHIEFYKYRDGITSLFDFRYLRFFIFHLGENGVFLFFVLSGFLITYLLFDEKDWYKDISLKKFYLRRIYRIWPLYFLIVIVSFWLLPFMTKHIDIFSASPYYFSQVIDETNYSGKSFILFISFLPNVALLVYNKFIVGCSQLWSVGIEEQFYLFWPLLIIIFSKKKIIGVFLIIILFFGFTNYSVNPLLKIINKTFPFQYMAIGSLGAVIYKYHKEKVINILQKKLFYYLILIAIFLLLFFEITNHFYQNLLLSFLFLSLILITINSNFRLLNHSLIVYLGKVSYGIYMYHFLAMYFIIPAANKYLLENLYLYNLVIYFIVFLLTSILSHFSFKYFETFFLRMKEKKFIR